MRGERFHHSCRDVPALAIFVMRTNGGTHTGILHRNRGVLWVLDLCWHERLRSSPCRDDLACVVPDLEAEEINDLTGMCRLIDRRHQEQALTGGFLVPYAFRFNRETTFSAVTGELLLAEGVGLSCSTFVLTVFESAKVSLVDLTGWPARPEDEAQQTRLLRMMQDGIPGFAPPALPEHVERVRSELPCVRVRPEEVAASAMADDLPANFERVERGGRWIMECLTDDIQRAWI
jgi:hypothetical protein